MRTRSLACILLTAATLSSAAGKRPAAKPDTEKKTMTAPVEEWQGQHGGRGEPGHLLVADLKSWKAISSQLSLNVPAPDFAKSVVVAAFAGERPTGGFAASFDDPAVKGDDLIVRWRVKKPAVTAFVTQSFTQPWKARVFRRPKGNVLVEFSPE